MKRNTLKNLDVLPGTRFLKRNNSQRYAHCRFNGSLKYDNKSKPDFICSKYIASTCLKHIICKTEQQFQQIDVRNRIREMLKTTKQLQRHLQMNLSPLDYQFQTNIGSTAELEPKLSQEDCFCRGAVPLQEGRQVYNRRNSLASSIGEDIKSKKAAFSSLGLINDLKVVLKSPKQHGLENRKSLEVLASLREQGDRVEQLLRDRILKEPQRKRLSNLNRSKQAILDRPNLFIEQYSYDYDGSAFPLKKKSKYLIEKVKILNTTYRISNKDVVEDIKKRISAKNQDNRLKTQEEEPERQHSFLKVRDRKMTSESMRNLLRVGNELPCEINFDLKMKMSQLMRGRAVRIRELKLVN